MSVLVNGCPTEEFFIGKGLRQGDPLSPFLFNLVVEVLSKMMDKARERGMIKGIGFNNDELHITHLQFADDTMLFIDPYMNLQWMSPRRVVGSLLVVTFIWIHV